MKYIDNDTLKRELKSEWIKQGYTQKDIADKMHVSSANLSNILVNKKSLSFNDVFRICEAMDLDLYIDFRKRDWFFFALYRRKSVKGQIRKCLECFEVWRIALDIYWLYILYCMCIVMVWLWYSICIIYL